MMASCLLSPGGAWLAAAATTALAALESSALPWSPFILLYAVALPALAFAGGARFGPLAEPFQEQVWAIAALSALMLAWEIGCMEWAFQRNLLPRWGKNSPYHSPALAMEALVEAASARLRMKLRAVQGWYGAYFLLWAPVAEELFFWGYLYATWRPAYGFALTAFAVSAVFALRHALHFLYLRPGYPWGAAGALVLSTFVSGLLNSRLYELTDSLWPLIMVHFVSNLLVLFVSPPSAPSHP